MTDEPSGTHTDQPITNSPSAPETKVPDVVAPTPADTSMPINSDAASAPAVEPMSTSTPIAEPSGTVPKIPAPDAATAPTNSATAPPNPNPPQEPLPHAASNSIDIKALQPLARAAIAARKQKRLEKILHFIDARKSITNDQVQMLLRVSDRTATRYLQELKAAGKIQQIGHGTSATTHYTKM